MSFRMYVYEMGIVDFYNGMMPLKEYIKLCSPTGTAGETHYLPYRELKGFLINCFMEVFCCNSYWEGDIRGLDEIAISAIPRPTGNLPYKLLVFKQNNNGSSFLVSECKLHFNKEDESEGVNMLHINQNVDYRNLMEYFYKAFDLVENLFDFSLRQEDHKSIHSKDEINKAQLDEVIIQFNHEDKENKFDLKNYQKL